MNELLVAECEGVCAAELAAFLEAYAVRRHAEQCIARWSGNGGHEQVRTWVRRAFPCCHKAVFWKAADTACQLPTCPVCDPVGARRHDGRAIDKLARALWKSHPDVVLAEMDRKLEAAELGGDALEALVHASKYVRKCEAEIERLRAELDNEREQRREVVWRDPDLDRLAAELAIANRDHRRRYGV